MVKFEISCYLKGDNFSENNIVKFTGLTINSVKISKNPIKNPIRRFGKIVTIKPSDNGIYEDDYVKLIEKFSNLMEKKIPAIKNIGCEKVVLYIEIKYVEQCNFEFSNKLLSHISNIYDDFYFSIFEEYYGIDRTGFSDYLHEIKYGVGRNGKSISRDELEKLAKQYKEIYNKNENEENNE